jgi:hypothetical protein
LVDRIKENVKARANTMLGEKEMHRGLRWWNLKERDCLKDQGIERRIPLVEPEGKRLLERPRHRQEDTIGGT